MVVALFEWLLLHHCTPRQLCDRQRQSTIVGCGLVGVIVVALYPSVHLRARTPKPWLYGY